MGVRIVKHLGSRACPADDSKVLHVVPFFPGEKVLSARLSAYCASGDDSAADQPSECNWYGLTLPWSLAFASNMVQTTPGAVNQFTNTAAYDNLFEVMLRASDPGTADVYWGGDVDADPDIGEQEGEYDPSQPRINEGPIGVHRWFSREVVMRPFASEGNNVIRFGDEFEAERDGIPSHNQGGLALFGMVRFEHAVNEDFAPELDDDTAEEAMGLLISGDYQRIQMRIHSDTTALGDFIRTVLYGGDHYVEASTLKGAAATATVKGVYRIQTAIEKFDR